MESVYIYLLEWLSGAEAEPLYNRPYFYTYFYD